MRRLLVFGLDGATLELLDDYVRERPGGAFERALADGHSRPLRSTMPFFTAPSWTTFMTGLDPGRHGMFHWRGRHDSATGGRPLLSSAHLEEASLWWWAQVNGARVSVSNFPMQYPAPITQGRYLCGTLAPESAPDASWPPALLGEVRALVPGYRFEMDKGISYLDRPTELRDHILDIGAGHARAFEEALGVADADLVVHVATVTDRMQHFFWHHIDPEHPEHANAPAALGNPIAEAYALAERSLQTALDSGAFDAVLLISDHGAGRSTVAWWLDAWLIAEGLAVPDDDGRVIVERSMAYSGEEPECAVYVNREGRDGCGLPDDRYDAFVDDLRRRLLAVALPGGGPALLDVIAARDLYDGPYGGLGPDLVLVPADGVHPRPGASDAVFSSATRLYCGHRRDGMMVAVGAGLPAGRVTEPMDMDQMFALACVMAGLPVPSGLAGALPPALAATAATDPRDWRAQVTGPPAHQAHDAQMLERLSELGYT
jgi:predicted AlkP superfamily phosphohydrolase/phosphomutase